MRWPSEASEVGRRDLKEVDRLNDTCPTEAVRIQSPAYFGRLRGFYEIEMMHGLGARNVMLGIWACLTKLRLRAELIAEPPSQESGSDTAESVAFSESSTQSELAQDDALGAALADLVGRLLAYRGAWANFCAGIGVDPEATHFAHYRESQIKCLRVSSKNSSRTRITRRNC